jgi:hypothetical protein
MKIDVSNGELVDKWTILTIKLDHITSPAALQNIQLEYRLLSEAMEHVPHLRGEHVGRLLEVNTKLWNVEEELRAAEHFQLFDSAFVEKARSVYVLNDERACIKRVINEETNSMLIEEKCYDSNK